MIDESQMIGPIRTALGPTASARSNVSLQRRTRGRLDRIQRPLLNRIRRVNEGCPPTIASTAAITLRLAGRDDEGALEELAQLSERARPAGPSLVAEVDGRVQAALPHLSLEPLVDPFIPTNELHALLRLRAAQLDASDPAWAFEDDAEFVPLAEPHPAQTDSSSSATPAPLAGHSSALLANS